MTITRKLTLALNQFTQDVARARADYQAHPSEFSKPTYCIVCSELKSPRRALLWRCWHCQNEIDQAHAR